MDNNLEYQREYLVSIGDRPWGSYLVLLNAADHKVKEITVKPGHRLSLQRHKKREEHWFIQQGQALVTVAGREVKLGAGEYIDIPRAAIHRIANPSPKDSLIFIEIQTGEYFGEDDIERFEDDYARE
jgi:mannose-6-phosphate isomerase-like protein (cupin superfamily)